MKLTPAQQKQLDKLTALANSDDDDDDFEIEIREGDRSARVPYRKGKNWLETHFGITLDTPGDGDDNSSDENSGDDDDNDDDGKTKTKPPRASQKYFGKNKG